MTAFDWIGWWVLLCMAALASVCLLGLIGWTIYCAITDRVGKMSGEINVGPTCILTYSGRLTRKRAKRLIDQWAASHPAGQTDKTEDVA